MTVPDVLRAPKSAGGALERAARVGFVTKGVLYLTVAVFAIVTALGSRGRGKSTTETSDAMTAVLTAPFGRVLLGIMAAGLAGYGLWRVLAGVIDLEDHGRDAKGVVMRVVDVLRGAFHLVLAYTAAKLALTQVVSASTDNEERASRAALQIPGGAFLLGGVAIGIAIYGGYQLYCAARSKLGERLEIPPGSMLTAVCRVGLAARGIVFLSLAILFARAAYNRKPDEAGGVGDSLRELFALGTLPKLGIAVGLAAYAVYQFVEARYRRIEIR